MTLYNLVSMAGMILLLGTAWLFSANKRIVNWRVIIWGTGLQLLIAFFIFTVPAGAKLFLFLNDLVITLLGTASEGSRFVFGRLALPPGAVAENGETSLGFILAFQGLAGVVFFAALVAILYHTGIIPKIIRGFAWVFTRLMRVSGAESLCASSNIFVGIESTLTVKPHLERMTRSELMTVLTAGMATVASNILAMYVAMLSDVFPSIAGHLMSASLLSAPAALVMAKIILPETGSPETLGLHVTPHYEREDNLLSAIIAGANSGVKLIAGIAALLIAVVGLVALADLILATAGEGIHRLFHVEFDWSLKGLLGLLFYPFTLILGIPPADAVEISRIIGERAVVTEIAAYQDLAALIKSGSLEQTRSAVICTYALCGFAHVASLAIFTGGLAALIPGRTKDISVIGPRALLAATLACLMTACMAGIFYTDNSILLSGGM
ncbi:nucleoside transporter [bacterium]|nr:nucleoside transporter [bacterium]